MAIDFPNSPSVNDQFTSGTTTWYWTGTVWKTVSSTTVTGPTGPTGSTGATGPTGSSGIVSQTSAPANTSVLWLDTSATATGVDLDAWTAYTPTWTSDTSSPVVGNGSITGRYKQIGKVVFFEMKLVWGTTTTGGAGSWMFTLPVTAYNELYQFSGSVLDNGVSWFPAIGNGAYKGSTAYFTPITSASGTHSWNSVSSNTPFTWGSGDYIVIAGSYEAA